MKYCKLPPEPKMFVDRFLICITMFLTVLLEMYLKVFQFLLLCFKSHAPRYAKIAIGLL